MLGVWAAGSDVGPSLVRLRAPSLGWDSWRGLWLPLPRWARLAQGRVRMTSAVTASSDALAVQASEGGSQPTSPLHLWPESDGFHVGTLVEANDLLVRRHYLGPIEWARFVICQWVDGQVVGAMVFRSPTTRHLPSDGTWFELVRWCLTPEGGQNAGSRMHKVAVAELRRRFPSVTTLVSYSDRSAGHTGALYRASNWQWRPAWNRVTPPPTGGGSWDGVVQQEPKDRWIYPLRPDTSRESFLRLDPVYERRLG